jgi:hypothetical protein
MKKENKRWRHDTREKPINNQIAHPRRKKSNTGKTKSKTKHKRNENKQVSRSLGKFITRRNGDILGENLGERSIKPKSSCYLGLWPPCKWFWVQLPTSSFYMLPTMHNFSIMGNWVLTMCVRNFILLITTSSRF